MTTSESAARAVAVQAPAEEPVTGLFPEKAPTPPEPEEAVRPQTAPAPEAETEAETDGQGEPEAGQARARSETDPDGEPEARTGAEEEAPPAPAQPATTPGRPGKPLVAAAVAGGVILIGATLLISGLSGSDDETAATSAAAPAGSRMGPDDSGPGFVPGRQNAPGDDTTRAPRKGEPTGSTPNGKGGDTAKIGGVHEAGAPEEKSAGHKVGKTGTTTRNTTAKTSGTTEETAADHSSSGKPPAGSPAKDSAQVAPVTYSHFIGPGCNTPGFATSDRWRDSNEGWRGSGGSQTSYGCSGFYYSLPMSGSSTKTTDWAQWKFPTGDVTRGSCQVSVFIPNVRDVSYVGGSPAHYTVHRYFEAKSSTVIDTFEINQTAHLGQWVNAGTFPVSTGKISIVLDNRGSGANNRHAAAAPIKVNCKSS